MQKLTIIGNVTNEPEMRTTQNGKAVCSFTVAVNRRKSAQAGQQEADFFRVSAWQQLGQVCHMYLAKGRKVAVVGSVSASAYTGNDGKPRASLEVMAEDVEFLSPRSEADAKEDAYAKQEREAIQNEPTQGSMLKQNTGFVEVDDSDDLPF